MRKHRGRIQQIIPEYSLFLPRVMWQNKPKTILTFISLNGFHVLHVEVSWFKGEETGKGNKIKQIW